MTLLDIIKLVQNHFCLLTCNFLVQIHKICNIYSIFLFFFCKCNALKHIIKHRSKNSLQVKVQKQENPTISQLTDGSHTIWDHRHFSVRYRQFMEKQILNSLFDSNVWKSLRKLQIMPTFSEIAPQYQILGRQESGILLQYSVFFTVLFMVLS